MPRARINDLIRCRYFLWRLGKRGDIYVADGRSNQPSAGRHSLGTRNREDALDNLAELDRIMAVKKGLADPSVLQAATEEMLPLTEGRELYEAHVLRPQIAGGPRPKTASRYRAVLNKFLTFAESQQVEYWNQVDRQVLENYAAWLDSRDYAYATEYLELTSLKQIVKWLVESGRLPSDCRIILPLRKPTDTDTYCWRQDEVRAMVELCDGRGELHWLRGVIVALACTGLRISELAALRWSDLDCDNRVIVLADESKVARRKLRRTARTTKGGRGRSFPMHESLHQQLQNLPKTQDGLVFHGPRGGVLKPDTVRRILIRDVLTPLAARFPTADGTTGFRDGRLHSFRHYFCSRCANDGVPEQVIMRWLGHRSSRMVRHYYHLHDEESQRQMSRLEFL